MGMDFVSALKARMGYQLRVVYCKDCRFSIAAEPPIEKPYYLRCSKHSDLETFPTMKSSTCSHSEHNEIKSQEGTTSADSSKAEVPEFESNESDQGSTEENDTVWPEE